jgi:hypothetical protein
MITENTFRTMARPMIVASDKMTLNVLSRVRAFAIRAVNDPTALTAYEREILALVRKDLGAFGRDIRTFSDTQIADAYIRGIESTNADFRRAGVAQGRSPIPAQQIFAPNQANPSEAARQALTRAGYASHTSYVGAFQQAMINETAKMQFQILRETRDVLRSIQAEATRVVFLQSDTITRRSFQQEIVNRIADTGIPAVRYADGRMVSVDAYSEMSARTILGNSARQATLNRNAELGNDLVRMSTHARTSPMCEPWEGGVYSETGANPNYPTLQEAIDGGAFHPNCKHALAPYYEGLSPALQPDGTPEELRLGNEATYKAEQEQRYYERGIRRWKQREAVALSLEEADKAKARVELWQGKQREHINENDYLKRQYQREQI